MDLKTRKRIIAEPSWITLLKVPQERCDGIKWSKVALRDIFSMNGETPPRGIQERAKCKRKGWYRFKSLKNSYAKDGVYCYSHLSQQIFTYPPSDEGLTESRRFNRWLRKHYPDLAQKED